MKFQLCNNQPTAYLLIGNGRLATHLAHYFSLLNLPFTQWSRNSEQSLAKLVTISNRVLLLINDDQIDGFIESHPELHEKVLIHCSGALNSHYAICAHPLASFSHQLYDLAFYQSIPFIIDHDSPVFSDLLPGLPNPHHTIEKKLRPIYHALCVLSGNFSTILWQKFFNDIAEKLNLPKELGIPYLQSISSNLQDITAQTLTGPLARGDQKTIAANLAALQGDSFAEIYQAFVRVFTERSHES